VTARDLALDLGQDRGTDMIAARRSILIVEVAEVVAVATIILVQIGATGVLFLRRGVLPEASQNESTICMKRVYSSEHDCVS